jgi:hypothetical protein|tara:strand:- start:991 stop:1101 length:111 start_codon:yes stop_codon:yes gene_type:complete
MEEVGEDDSWIYFLIALFVLALLFLFKSSAILQIVK